MNRQQPVDIQAQRGAVLAVGLVILLVLTLIGIVSLQSSSMEEKMAGNMRDMNLALQSTETTLREAETFIDGIANTSGFGTSGGLYTLGNAPDPFASGTWTGASSITSTTSMGNVIQPRYFIELLGEYGEDDGTEINIFSYGQGSGGGMTTVFRIIARGTGATGTSQIILESFYGRQF